MKENSLLLNRQLLLEDKSRSLELDCLILDYREHIVGILVSFCADVADEMGSSMSI